MASVALNPQQYKMVINGELVDAINGDTMEVINPATGEVLALAPKATPADVSRAVEAAAKASPGWAVTPVAARSALLLKLAQSIRVNLKELAKLETMEQGSPIRRTMSVDIPACANQLEFYAGAVRAMHGETLPLAPWCTSYTVREPLGVVGLITPWNFPALMVIWKLGAALATGNTCIVKPPSTAPLTTLRIGELAMQAGFPPGVVNVITGPGSSVGEAMVAHPDIARIGFTGDTSTGKRIAKMAADTVKVLGLELGGKNPFIVMKDADLAAAVQGAVFGAFFNGGQVCASASRIYVHESVYDEFTNAFVTAASKLKIGNPLEMATVVGPVAYKGHRDDIESHIEQAKQQGAKLLLGGKRPETADTRNGFFVAPTIFGDCTNDMELMQVEIFGPVVGLARFSTAEEAVLLANDTRYGLAASVWTSDLRLGLKLANQIKAGTVWLNEHLLLFCEAPWGGCKESGWGKDMSTMALEEYTMTKHIYIDLGGQVDRPWYGIMK